MKKLLIVILFCCFSLTGLNTVDEMNRPKVGVAVIVIKNDKILFGKRKSIHGQGCWGWPGGHLEYSETIQQCALRELEEETGLKVNIDAIQVLDIFTNDIFENQGKHYITLFTVVNCFEGEAQILEPDKCEGWYWFAINEFPKPLFTPIVTLINQKDIATLLPIKN